MTSADYLSVCLLVLAAGDVLCSSVDREFPPFDGWFNNLLHPDWGGAETQMLRRSKTAYADSVYHPSGKDRPNPLDISKAAHHGPAGQPSTAGRTAMLVFFGQQIVEEIVDSQRPGCPVEYFNIRVPKGHSQFDSGNLGNVEMTFKRTRYDQRTGYSPNNPRQQLNEITPFIDGQVIYGPNKAWSDAIRSLKGGRLAGSNAGTIVQEFPPNNTIRLPYANPPVAREHVLKPVTRFHTLGNPRGHENPFLLSFGILWFRWHNRMADRIGKENPTYNDEQIFNVARRRVIALYQKIVFYDWLPVWLDTSISPNLFKQRYPYRKTVNNGSGPEKLKKKRNRNRQRKPQNERRRKTQTADTRKQALFSSEGGISYSGYDPSIHPGIYQEFQAAAMRFGHTLVTPGLWRRTGNCDYLRSRVYKDTDRRTFTQYAALRLCNSFWNSRESVEEDLDAIFRGMASTIAEKEDSVLVPDLTDSLFGPLEFSRRDLAALNIQRGRDHGLSDYNTVREAYGLERKVTWTDINKVNNRDQLHRLAKLYPDGQIGPDNVDLFTGGMLETTNNGPGELFKAIILEQFLRIRHGDRFWFENTEYSGLTPDELTETWSTTLVDVIHAATGVGTEQTQFNVFRFLESDNQGCFGQLKQLDPACEYDDLAMLEPCLPLQRYDYFTDSEVSYALTLLVAFLCIPITFLLMFLLARRRRQTMFKSRPPPPPLQRTSSSNPNEFKVLEWLDSNQMERICVIVLDRTEKRIDVFTTKHVLLRYVDLKLTDVKHKNIEVHLSSDKDENVLAIKLKEYDLVLKFFNVDERNRFLTALESLFESCSISTTTRSLVESYILRNTVTRQHRQEKLNKFFKKILNMFHEGQTTNVDENIYGTVDTRSDDLARIELTQAEFGEAFGMKPNCTFVKHMFLLVDKDKSGHVSFREFMDIFILLSSDDTNDKIRLLFNMYDINCHGFLSKDDLYKMVRSLLEMSENNVSNEKVREFADSLYQKAGIRVGAEISFKDFKQVFTTDEYAKTIANATMELNAKDKDEDQDQASTLQVPGMNSKMMQRRATLVRGYSVSAQGTLSGNYQRSNSMTCGYGSDYGTIPRHHSMSRLQVTTDQNRKAPVGCQELYEKCVAYLETYRLQVFWMTLYILVTACIFAERAHFYAYERENGGLRRIAGQGVTMSRGSASVIMFTYAGLMLTMCKNLITVLRETFLHRFIPFDSLHSMHKFIACLSLVFTVCHVIFHGINLYHICTQPSTDLNCYFREYYRASHELATFRYWAYGTTTGFTGIILTVLVIVLFMFSLPYARRHLFHAFWSTHKLYIAIYIFVLIHGSARMVQNPHFPYYFIGPAVCFVIDKIVSMSRTKLELTVLKAELLPSDVTAITVKKPDEFRYMSGQWAQVACSGLGTHEFHPFTMTSAPHEKNVTFHIRAVGPWTMNFRRIFDPANRTDRLMPKLLLDGPFGEGHQDWYRYEVSVLIGGGIGVTPFASIIKDIVHKSAMDITIQCKKVYFLWVTRTQKQFEWVADIIRDLEAIDHSKFVTTHIFVTEFKSKFDLRTSMLYVCERHFQKIAGKSLFTGLEATTHFGRPRFNHFLKSLRYEHNGVRKIGVFSCGPRPMTLAVERACTSLNTYKVPTYYHHYENF